MLTHQIQKYLQALMSVSCMPKENVFTSHISPNKSRQFFIKNTLSLDATNEQQDGDRSDGTNMTIAHPFR
jgi:hypothetical protein